MKRLISALLALPLSCSIGEPIFAETTYQPGYSTSTQCFRDEYREDYVPGTKDKPGHVRNWTEKVEIPCQSTSSARKHQHPAPKHSSKAQNVDDNSCIEGSILGGLLGSAAGAALSRGDGRWIGLPVGGAAGAMLGCQVDGG